ncbi:MAG TPA: GNAT family N-acetyltransferase [Candidatus Binataceae bacterium]|nr:GNAT family N-acetyltransferase [Candidatus Binataceae bacterium]
MAQDKNRIAIRPARLTDRAELLALIRAYYRFDHIRFNARTIAPALDKLLRSRSFGRVWIMCDGARPAGYVVLTFNFDLEFGGLEGLVTDLFVDARYRGRGLGRRALDIVDNYCRARGIGMVELQVEDENVEAQAFYRKLGFKQLSRIVMTREVSARTR